MPHPPLRTLRLAAVNIDGVLLSDTFSPVIRRLVVRHGLTYTAELERAFFSQPQQTAARAFVEMTGTTATPDEILTAYFEERERYLRTHPLRLLDGAVGLLRLLRALGLRTVCYGGLDKGHFDRHLGRWASLFSEPRYICTNDFRPGVREITQDFFALDPAEALFVDDVAAVAERARDLGVPFIGHPAPSTRGFQRSLMREAGVRHIVGSLSDIDERLLRTVDREAGEGTVWQEAVTTGAARRAGELS